jgi:serine/threonine-protein kinase
VYPPELDELIATCLAKDPEERWQSAGDVARQLRSMQSRISQPHATVSTGGSAVQNGASRKWRWSVAVLGVAALVAAGAFWGIVQRAPSDSSRVTRFFITPPASAPLSDFGGIDVVISPDGQRIAYFTTDDRDQTATLYVRELDELEARDIPGTRVAQANIANPFMSSDGRSVGFYSIGEGVMRTAIDGGPVIKIVDAPAAFFGAAWRDDGTVVFSDAQAMYVVSSSGSRLPERLTPQVQAGDFSGSIYAAPTFLPDGRSVLMTVIRSDGERIALLDLETREQRIIIDGANGFYSPSGHLVFARGTTLFAAPFDLNQRNVAGDPVIVLRGVRHPNLNSAADYALSAEGTLVYVPEPLESSAASELVWVDRTGTITGSAVSEPIELAHDPRLSPDGRRLLVTIGGAGDRNLWIFDLAGRPPMPLARDGENRLGIWSPDGAQIAFAGIGTSASSLAPTEGVVPRFENILTIPADGSAARARIVRAAGLNCCPAAWSSQGELIMDDAPRSNIVAVSIDDADEIRDVVATPDVEGFAALSPDGQWLAYTSDRSGRPEVWAKRYPNGVASRVSSDGGTEPVWSRDGKELFFRQGTAVMVAPMLDGTEGSFGAATMLFDGPFASSSNALVRTYDVSPDGRILMARALEANERPPSSIVVVQNWADELERLVP